MKRPMRGGKKSRNRARRLRADPTEAEKRLWLALRPLRHSHALHIHRQMPLGPYIADFAIVSQKLVIEIDGGRHGNIADMARDTWMKARGYRVLRFWNTDIFDNLEGVMETIFLACGSPDPVTGKNAKEGPHPNPSPHAGRGFDDSCGLPSAPLPASGEGPGVGSAAQSRRAKP